jgi:hypothetical protein
MPPEIIKLLRSDPGDDVVLAPTEMIWNPGSNTIAKKDAEEWERICRNPPRLSWPKPVKRSIW